MAGPRKKKSPATAEKPTTQKPQKTEFLTYQSFHLQKKIKPDKKMMGSFRLFLQAVGVLKRNFKLFLGITIIYSLFYLVLVQGIASLDSLNETKAEFESTASGPFKSVLTGLGVFAQLLGSSGSLSATANSYQLLVTLLASLAIIWTLRQVYIEGVSVRIRDGYYYGMYPLVPFLLVVGVITLQLIPMAIGGALFSTVVNNGIAISTAEIVLWATGFFVLSLISLYMMTSSLFALYIVTLPNTAPMQALRSARQLVRGRRWQALRKVLFLPFAFILVGAVVVVPIVIFATPIVGWVFFVLLAMALTVGHSYMYALYRSLI
ncbi:MAG TPA: hypothetical protein VFB59_01150 [Candidatus Saccharimonadales bacterium]|nr:hypothetical protein [Candidatus Saccharimonadales bacterium]